MTNKKRLYTKEILEEAVKNSNSICDVCRFIGCKAKGGSYDNIRGRLKEYGIDISHFKGSVKYTRNNRLIYNKKKPEEVLIKNTNFKRINHSTLKRCLIESGVEYKCNKCGVCKWLEQTITLDVDHINGDWTDNTIENLRFLCPNCHRQTDTFCRPKQSKTKTFNYCKTCNKKIFNKRHYCSEKCKTYERRKNIPSKETVIEAFKVHKNMVQTSKYFKVSDNGLRKWCRIYNILDEVKSYKN